MMRFNVLGVAGLAGAGKSTLSKFIEQNAPDNAIVRIHPMAHTLKSIARQYGWDGAKDERGRALLQTLGQCFRDYDEKTWLREWFKHLMQEMLHTSLYKSHGCYIALVDDIRHHNEAAFVKQLGGTTLRLEGRGGLTGTAAKHASEIHIMNLEVDQVVQNDRSESHLNDISKDIIKNLISTSKPGHEALEVSATLRG